MNPDVLVVGAGFAGNVVAERLAHAGEKVLVIDRRHHVGGNAYDEFDAHGVLVHRYGPHIFHTNDRGVAGYLSRFTEWRPYEHRVLAHVDGKLLPIPINRDTVNRLYGLSLDEEGVKAFFERIREPRDPLRTSEDVLLNTLGRDLYEKFFRGYTRKQWGMEPSELDASVAARIPYRTNRDDRYFTDAFQAMPLQGYTAMFRRMLDHPNIRLELGVEFGAVRSRVRAGRIFYTGPLDAYFGCRFGKLPYRSLRFEHVHFPGVRTYQPVAVVNYPDSRPFTRVTEFKHLTGQDHPGTSIVREYAMGEGDPYYPVPSPESAELAGRYRALAAAEKQVVFIGRLGRYAYLNMDQVVSESLAAGDRYLQEKGRG